MDGNDDLEQYSRIPTIEDLVALCRNLNAHEVKYVVIGGLAVIHFGYIRATGDIDLLVEDSPIETKMGVRPKDVQDRLFLQRLIAQEQD